ncbi:hypothetical protein D5047_03815 [Verminephrobacter eiseniae]|nr:hypothetical protein [Verminephrobacter eiseniae]
MSAQWHLARNQEDRLRIGAGKPIAIAGGKGATQIVDDYHLSRFACYLIAWNGDPRANRRARRNRQVFKAGYVLSFRQTKIEAQRGDCINQLEVPIRQRVKEQTLFTIEWQLT